MKKFRLDVLLFILINVLLLLGVLLYFPYYVSENGLTASLFEMNIHLSARLSFFLMVLVVVYIFTQSIVIFKKEILNVIFIRHVCRFFTLVPLIGLVVWMVFDLFDKMNEYDFASLGINFVNANIGSYGTNLTHDDMISIGESLNIGFGYYFLWIMVVLVIVQYTYYYVKFNELYNLDDLY